MMHEPLDNNTNSKMEIYKVYFISPTVFGIYIHERLERTPHQEDLSGLYVRCNVCPGLSCPQLQSERGDF